MDNSREASGEHSPIASMIETLDKHAGPYFGDIFETAYLTYGHPQSMEQTHIIFNPQSSDISGGYGRYQGDDHDSLMIHFGTKAELPRPVRERMIKRLELPEVARTAPDELFQRFVFAHEVGHIIQNDPSFSTIFGDIDPLTVIPEQNYSAYVRSDKEVNADYIAATVIGSSTLGRQLGINPPTLPPRQWREWALQHPL